LLQEKQQRVMRRIRCGAIEIDPSELPKVLSIRIHRASGYDEDLPLTRHPLAATGVVVVADINRVNRSLQQKVYDPPLRDSPLVICSQECADTGRIQVEIDDGNSLARAGSLNGERCKGRCSTNAPLE
jgi:hypothetical protein